jgi:outer membrane receptor protein involved in Fe transport
VLTGVLVSGLFATAAAGEDPTDASAFASMSLQQLMNVKVVSAALHAQGVREAPASVTVITAADIRKYGYRTLEEALEGVRGVYMATDRTYGFLGARGLSIPGDYGSRFLLLIDGHSMADPIYDGSGYVQEDLPIELSLVRQIEIVHGPASALYGSNAVVCTINVITKHPGEMPRLSFTTDVGNFGEKKVNVTYAGVWRGVRALVSGAVFNYSGEKSIYIPGYDSPDTNYGRAIDVEGQQGYHFFSTVNWRNWSFHAMSGVRNEILPANRGAAIFNDRGNRGVDATAFLEGVYSRSWGRTEIEWRVSYDRYSYLGTTHYPLDGGGIEDNRESDRTSWAGSKLTLRLNAGRAGQITAGAETRIDLQTMQSNYDVQPEYLSYVNVNRRDIRVGVFLQAEIAL